MNIVITVPDWVREVAEAAPRAATPRDKMQLAIALAEQNLERGGGPFGAVVFEGDRPVAAGVNLVLASGYSLAHAEVVAILVAQRSARARASDDQASRGEPRVLYTSAEPCCQCFGAFVWSGLDGLVAAATTADVEAIGFHEGPKPEQWARDLERLGMSVDLGLERDDARRVLARYRSRGGAIYGPALAESPRGLPRP